MNQGLFKNVFDFEVLQAFLKQGYLGGAQGQINGQNFVIYRANKLQWLNLCVSVNVCCLSHRHNSLMERDGDF